MNNGGVYYQIDPQYDRTLPDGTPNYTRVFYPNQQQPQPTYAVPIPVAVPAATATTTTTTQAPTRAAMRKNPPTGEAKYFVDANTGEEMKWCTSCESFDPLATWPIKGERDATAGSKGITLADSVKVRDELPMNCGSCKAKRQAKAKDKNEKEKLKRDEAKKGKQQANEEE